MALSVKPFMEEEMLLKTDDAALALADGLGERSKAPREDELMESLPKPIMVVLLLYGVVEEEEESFPNP